MPGTISARSPPIYGQSHRSSAFEIAAVEACSRRSEAARLTSPNPPLAIPGDPTVSDLDISALGSRAVVQLVARTIVTRGITLLGTIALARLLSPSEFGVFAVVTVIVVLISLVGDFGIGSGLVQQERTPTGLELSTVFAAQLAIWTGLVGVTWVVAAAIPTIRPDLPPEAPGLTRLLAASLLFAGLRGVPTAMLTRVLRFGPLAAIEIAQQIAYFGTAIALAAAGYGVWSFGIAALVQGLLATVAVYVFWPHWVGLRFDLQIARRLWRFGISYQGGHVLAWGRDGVVPIFGTLAGGLAAVGILGFAWRNGQLVSAVEQIVARVAFPAFSRLQGDQRRLASAARISLELSVVAVCLVQAWVIATAEVVVPVVFSDAWTAAVVPLQLVCIGSLAGAPTFVLRTYMYACDDGGRALVLSAVSLVVLFVTFPLLATGFGLIGASWSFTLSAAAGLALFIWATHTRIAFPWLASLRVMLGTAAPAVIAGLIVRNVDGLAGVIISGCIYLGLALVALRITAPNLTRAIIGVVERGSMALAEPTSPGPGARTR